MLSVHHSIDTSYIESIVLQKGVIFVLFTGHSQVVRSSLASSTLLGLTRSSRTVKSIESIVIGILLFHIFSIEIFLWCVFGITFLELKLCLAFETLNQITHLPDSFVLEGLVPLASDQSSNLVFHHVLRALFF